jgi:hypothetical protein
MFQAITCILSKRSTLRGINTAIGLSLYRKYGRFDHFRPLELKSWLLSHLENLSQGNYTGENKVGEEEASTAIRDMLTNVAKPVKLEPIERREDWSSEMFEHVDTLFFDRQLENARVTLKVGRDDAPADEGIVVAFTCTATVPRDWPTAIPTRLLSRKTLLCSLSRASARGKGLGPRERTPRGNHELSEAICLRIHRDRFLVGCSKAPATPFARFIHGECNRDLPRCIHEALLYSIYCSLKSPPSPYDIEI